ncbi:MAG TPA: hypothetical protein VFX51_26250 [Solirubrobacteraceae bacterium]|nr:hypothetical protein [Solirubrobacteraceae bacterium]
MTRLTPLLLTALLAGALVGCGTDKQTDDGQAAKLAAKDREKAAQRQADLKEAQQVADDAQAAADACQGQMNRLLQRTRALDSRLDIGLTYDEYGDKVADLKVAYDNIDFDVSGDDGSFTCLSSVGVPLENALNQYVSAYRTWNTCFDDLDCDTDSISPDLQAKWSKATRNVSRASAGLKKLNREVERAQEEVERLS